ncbi:MAG: hypothetical protein JXA18_15525 [Chitinispirillaceae bacterium]|nr:hypothetical protein [Chitinispirillaceae bacterium]
MKKVIALLIGLFFSTGLFMTATAENGDDNLLSKIKLSGFGYYMFGQIVSGIYGDDWEAPTTSFEHLWLNTSLLHLNLESNVSDWFTTKLGLEFYVTFPLKGSNAMDKSSYFRTYKAYLAEAAGIMHWDFEHPILSSLTIKTGMLPYTINPEVKTLGNYLFRSTVHPLSVQNKVDYPWADLLGGVAEAGFFENRVRFEAILASEFNYVPFFDFTPAFGLYYKPNEIIDVGGAIAFHHAIQANCALMPDSLGEKWQGVKLDFRAIFDPKPIFGGMDFLGKDQLKIYAEVAFLGLKDSLEVDTSQLAMQRTLDPSDSLGLNDLVFPANTILHRMPMTLGISFPTWKIVDVLALELEWFSSPYANDWFGKFDSQKAEARAPSSLKQWDNYINKDNFKWSLYMKKALGKFEVKGIFSSDHTIYLMNNVSNGNFEQTLKRPKDWHWLIQLRYNL